MNQKEIEEFCKKARLLSKRDTEGTTVIVFKSVLCKKEEPITSTELSKLSGLHRLTVRHHLERLKEQGLLEEKKGKYKMKFNSIEDYVDFRRKKMIRMFEELENMAERMDKEFIITEKRRKIEIKDG
ncbi:ArsR family transcriptional regulator [Candidatus Micrarchaeota archaeon]|nr:ArsR family transcriptional regulator [Candidatus Micrarchaeota archaeon]